MSTIFKSVERGLAVQAGVLGLSTLAPMRVQLFLGENIAAGLIGEKKIVDVSDLVLGQLNCDCMSRCGAALHVCLVGHMCSAELACWRGNTSTWAGPGLGSPRS